MVIDINIVYVLEKTTADTLVGLGFKYNEKEVDNKKVYQFFGTDELMKELTSKFDASSFFVSKNYCF